MQDKMPASPHTMAFGFEFARIEHSRKLLSSFQARQQDMQTMR